MLIPDLLRRQAQRHPDRIAVDVDGFDRLTYAEWESRSNRLGRALVAAGIAPGERVALRFSNSSGCDYLVAYMAIHKAAAVAVPLNPSAPRAELRHVLQHAATEALLGEPIEDGPPIQWSATDIQAATADDSEFQVPCAPDDLADILYTSGTTGLPKGVACTHDSIVYKGASQLHKMFAGAAFLHAVPLFTFAGTHAMTVIALKGGMTHIIQPRFDPDRFLVLLTERKVALSYAVPAMVLRMLDRPAIAQGGFDDLRLLMYGTAPMPPAAIRSLAGAFPSAFLINLYGLTEGGGAVCSLPPHEALARPASIGKPLPPTEVRIVDEDGTQVPPSTPGEITMRAPMRRRWYFKDPAATENAWTEDGWLRTGDIGYLDEDGYLYLVDRKKDLIIVGGHNVSAIEVEGVLLEHPSVRDAAIVGMDHPVMGEVPRAFVVAQPDADLTGDELEAFAADRLAKHKVPRNYVFTDELPRNALGKVLKRVLRQRPEVRP